MSGRLKITTDNAGNYFYLEPFTSEKNEYFCQIGGFGHTVTGMI
jgi:hypothetical protein